MRYLTVLPFLAGALLAGCSKPSGAETGPAALFQAKDPKATVAQVDGAPITEGDLMVEAKPGLTAVETRFTEEVYAQKVRALDRLVEKRLLETQAKKEGLTVDAYLDREVARKVPEPTDAALQAVYDRTKANGRSLPPFPDVKGEIAAFVKEQTSQELRQALVGRLRAAAKVQSFLPPLVLPKVEFKADGPSRGNASAPVTIVEFSDYECEYCSVAEVTVSKVLADYKGRVRLVHQPFPLAIHSHARKAAEAALCAGEQGRYWEMHDSLFAGQGALGVSDLKGRARALGLDGGKFDACVDSGRMAATVDASKKLGEGIGVSATPAFFVNGRPLSGAQPYERFKEVVDGELAGPGR